ncbi:unnamed protein product [Notodromas monacha]|uniref:deoxyhypusine synthase n=1 Tax=Notodromas monacha TaxID=399045 RepID=A0A7R9BGK9_9CRUS|nr:unnamed protein product [Notodromas monacha]CAG0915075.1 unnamed protein product [Notodromas monacha]
MTESAADAVFKKSDQLPESFERVKGYDFNSGVDYEALLESYRYSGFQATNFGLAVEEIRKMVNMVDEVSEHFSKLAERRVMTEDECKKAAFLEDDEFIRRKSGCTIFLGYTSNMSSCGVRDVIRFLVQHKLVDCLVTSAGGVEEDLIKCIAPTFLGDFSMAGKQLREKGINRIGNLLVPNDNYCKFESWITPILDSMRKEQLEEARTSITFGRSWTPSTFVERLGLEMNHDESICTWAARNKIPIFSPALTDGSIGDMLYFHSQKKPGMTMDIIRDICRINNMAIRAKKTGMLIVGGGLVKHHICNANLMRNGADFSVFLNTSSEYDGSDSGARPDEAVSWGKIRMSATPVKSLATIEAPKMVKSTAEWPFVDRLLPLSIVPKPDSRTASCVQASGWKLPNDNARGHGSGVNLSPTSGDGAGSGGRLARRARSFKDDLLERLTHVKTASSPTGDHNFPVMSASGSMKKPATASPALVAAAAAGAGFRPPQHQTPPGRPRNSRSRHGSTSRRDGRSTPTKDTLRKTSQKILKHFQDSVTSGIGSLSRNASTSASKEDVKAWTMSPPRSPNPAEIGNLQRKLSGALRYLKDAEEKGAWEQVPGAASVVLDTVYHILALVGDKLPNHQSAAIAVARNRVNVTVGELIKWSDDILLAHTECAAAASSIVAEVDVDLCAAAGARMPSLDSPAGEGWASSGQSSRTPSFSACVQPSLDSGCLVDALQDAVKCLVDTVEEKLAARDSSVSVDSSSDFDLDETRSDSSTRRSKLGAVKCSASVDWGESANKLSVPTEIVQRKSLPEIVMKTDVVVGSGGHHHHHHHHHHHNLHHRLHHQRPPTPPKRPPAPPMPEKSKLVHSHSSDSILDAGGRPVSGSLPYMTPPPPPPKPPPLSKDVLDSSLDSCVAPPLPPKRRQILNTIGGSPANPFSSSSLAYSAGNGQPPPLPPPRRTDIGGDPQAMLWRHERHSSSGEWKAASPSQAGPSSGGFFSGSGHQHHSHTPPPYLTSFDSTGSSSLVKARSCSWRRVSSGGNVSQSSSQSPLDDSMSACSGDSAFSTPMFSNRSFGDDERHMRSPTAALSASCDPFENLHAIAQELHQLSEMSVNPASTSTPKERRNLLGPPSAQGSNMAFVAMSASSSSSSFSSETRQMFAGGTVTTTASRYQASTTASSSMSLHPGATSAPPASPPPALPAKSRAPQAGPSHYDNLNLPRSKVCSPNTESSGGSFDDDWRPPLPPKKKHGTFIYLFCLAMVRIVFGVDRHRLSASLRLYVNCLFLIL